MELISVIVPAYNLENVIEKCILSIINQTYKNLEIIIIDDGSEDKTFEVIQKYAELDNRIKIYQNINNGVGFTYNFGIEKSTGEYIYILDGDNFIELETLEILYKNLITFNCDMTSCGYIYDDYDKGKYIKTRESINKEIYTQNMLEFMRNFKFLYSNHLVNSPCNRLYKREFIGEYRFQEDRNKVGTVDTYFNLNLIKNINNFKHISMNLVHYVQYPKEKRQLTNGWKIYDQKRIELISDLLRLIKSLYEKSGVDLTDYYNISLQHFTKISLVIAKSKVSLKTKKIYFECLKNTAPFSNELDNYSGGSKINAFIVYAYKSKNFYLIILISKLKILVERMPNFILNSIRDKVNNELMS